MSTHSMEFCQISSEKLNSEDIFLNIWLQKLNINQITMKFATNLCLLFAQKTNVGGKKPFFAISLKIFKPNDPNIHHHQPIRYKSKLIF